MTLELEHSTLTSEDILARAAGMTPQTPSPDIYALIAAALRQPAFPDGLVDIVSKSTGLAEGDLENHVAGIAKHFRLMRSTEAEALALDVLERIYAYGRLLRTGDDGTLYVFSGTHWGELPEQRLRQVMTTLCLERPMTYGAANRSVGAALRLIRDLAPPAGDLLMAPLKPVVNTRTAEVWIGADGAVERRIHRPETGMRYVLPVDFDPDAVSPVFDATLAEILSRSEGSEELERHLLELLGYAIQPVRDLPVIAFFWGGGANGKSLLLSVLRAIVGREQVLAATLTSLMRDRFMVPNLAGKLLFVEDDAKDNVELNDGLLKQIAENKIIDSRRVRSTHGMSFMSMVLPLIAINGAPKLQDTSDGMRRRLQIIPFDRQFKAAEIKPDLGRIITDSELPGVLNRLIEGLARLRARGRFEAPEAAERAKEAFLAASNPLLEFVQERCQSTPGKRTALRDVYQAYVIWMKQTGQTPDVTMRSLRPKLVAMGYNVHKSSNIMVEDLTLRDA